MYKNIEAKRAAGRRTYREKKRRTLEFVCNGSAPGGPPRCAGCGETDLDVLTIHHIVGSAAKERDTFGWGHKFYDRVLTLQVPREHLVVLCYNCHKKRHAFDDGSD